MVLAGVSLNSSGTLCPKSKTRKSRKRNSGSSPKNTYTKDDVITFAAGEFYSKRYQEYLGTSRKFFKTGVNKDHRSWKYFEYVVNTSKELGVTPELFIEAQIWWFNKRFRMFPRPYQLTPLRGMKPPETVLKEWQTIFGKCADYYVQAQSNKVRNELPVTYYETLLSKTAKNFNMTPAEVIALFGTELFPQEFLKSRLAE